VIISDDQSVVCWAVELLIDVLLCCAMLWADNWQQNSYNDSLPTVAEFVQI